MKNIKFYLLAITAMLFVVNNSIYGQFRFANNNVNSLVGLADQGVVKVVSGYSPKGTFGEPALAYNFPNGNSIASDNSFTLSPEGTYMFSGAAAGVITFFVQIVIDWTIEKNGTNLGIVPGLSNVSANVGDQITVSFSGTMGNYVKVGSNIIGNSQSSYTFTVTSTTTVTLVSSDSKGRQETNTFSITVDTPATIAVTGVTLDKTTLSGQVGGSGALTATVSPANATNKSVTWSASNPSVATVANGTVSYLGAGTCTITATTVDGGYQASCSVTVTEPTYTVTVSSAGTGATGGGSYVAGATVSISAGTPPAGQQFKNWTTTSAGVTFANANSSSTSFTMPANAVTVTANFEAIPIVNAETPTITSQPQSATVYVGDAVSLSVAANVTDGGTLTYQWYQGGAAIGGATGSSYSPSTATAGTQSYYVIVTNTNNSVNGTKTATVQSSTATVTVNAIPIVNAQTPTITSQPQSATVNTGDAVSLSVAANVTDGGTLTYQWYQGGAVIGGATGSSYSPSTATAGTQSYYVIVTNTNNSVNGTKTASVTSSTATVTVNAIPIVNAQTPTITSQPQSATVNTGDAVSLSVAANVTDGGTLTYQWYQGGAVIGGATGSSYSPSTATAGTQSYYVIVTNTNNSVNGTKTATVQSNMVTVTVNTVVITNAQTPTISSQPQSATVNVGDAVSLSVTANITDGGTLTYQWYQGGAAISGATGNSYSPSTATTGTQSYYVIVTNTNNSVNGTKTASVTSSTATVTVSAIPVVTYTLTVNSGSGGGNYEAGTVVNILANAAPAGQSFDQWTGDIAGVANATSPNTTYTVGNANAVVTATYKQNLSSNATLGSLTVSAGALTPAFNPNTTDYTVEVENAVAILVVSATASDGKATVSGAGEFALNVGENTIRILVTAEDGTTKTYTILVTRKQNTGIESVRTGIKIYAEGSSIRIASSVPMKSVEIYNLLGQAIRLIRPDSNQAKIDNLPTGVLVVKVSLQSGENETKKVQIGTR